MRRPVAALVEEAVLRDPSLVGKGTTDICRAAGLDPKVYRGNVYRYLTELRAKLPANLETLAQKAAHAPEDVRVEAAPPITAGEIADLERAVLREIQNRKLERAELPALLDLAKFLHGLAPMGVTPGSTGEAERAAPDDKGEQRRNPLVMLHERRRAASG